MSRPRSPGRVYARRYGQAPKSGETDKRRLVWWIEFRDGERVIRKSSESAKKQDANDLLKKRLGELGAGKFTGRAAQRLMFQDLGAMMVSHYQANDRGSLDTAERSIAHLCQAFGSLRARDITRDRGDAYIAARLKAKAARATIQKELAALGRMFTLAVQSG